MHVLTFSDPRYNRRQEYWSGLPFPTPGHLLDPGIEPASLAPPALQADSLPLRHLGNPTIKVLCFSSVDCIVHGVAKSQTQLSDLHCNVNDSKDRSVLIKSTGFS